MRLREPAAPASQQLGRLQGGEGPRIPDQGSSQKHFRIATIVLSAGGLLGSEEMAFFDHMSARGEARAELRFTSGFSSGLAKPFYLATGGRGTLSTGLPCLVAGSTDSDGDGLDDGCDCEPFDPTDREPVEVGQLQAQPLGGDHSFFALADEDGFAVSNCFLHEVMAEE